VITSYPSLRFGKVLGCPGRFQSLANRDERAANTGLQGDLLALSTLHAFRFPKQLLACCLRYPFLDVHLGQYYLLQRQHGVHHFHCWAQ
jgi:hypothetical protein